MRIPILWLACSAIALSLQRVEVLVRDSAGVPVPGARMVVEPLHHAAVADAQGRAVVSNLPAGRYWLRVHAVGFVPAEIPFTLHRDTVLTVVLAQRVVPLLGVAVEAQRPELPEAGASPLLVLTPRELDRHRGQSLGEVLRELPGMGVITTGPGIAKPSLRGLTGERLLVLNDKLPLYSQAWGMEHAPELDPLMVESVEVVRGTAAVRYGTEALAGVVRLVPALPGSRPGIHGQVRLEGFSANRQGAVSARVDAVQGPWAGQVLLSARRAADVMTPQYGLANTAYEQYMGTALLQSLFGHTMLRGRLQLYRGRLGVFAGMHLGNLTDLERALRSPRPLVQRPVGYEIRPPYQDVWHVVSELELQRALGEGQASLILGWQQNRRREYDAHRFWSDSLRAVLGGRAAYDVTLTSWSLRAEVEQPIFGGRFHAVADARRQGSVSEGLERFVPNFRSYAFGSGLWQQWFWQRWQASVGLRGDWLGLAVWRSVAGVWTRSQRRWVSAAVAALVGYVERPWELRASVASGWRAPTAVELFANGVHHGAAIFEVGDSTLAAERVWTAELSASYHTAPWHLEASAFAHYFPRFLAHLPTGQPVLTIRGAFPVFRYQGVPALLTGMELRSEGELLEWLRAELTATMLWGRELGQRQPLYGIPPPRLRLRMHAHLPSFGPFQLPYVELTMTAVGKRSQAPLDYAPPPAGYTVWDAALGAELPLGYGSIGIAVEVRNLFNRAYRDYNSRLRYFADEPGRDLIARLRWEW
ncbi:MAG: TonB-dependent receptor [Candidatus Kapabacteria bacterium]|nr:TonB-dependent receptor [Candidatus Kapabacteria bacterium]MDW8012202.1 TonB-dependent receptor [Bacteroidota bacterium]